jgi:hypothetical protein
LEIVHPLYEHIMLNKLFIQRVKSDVHVQTGFETLMYYFTILYNLKPDLVTIAGGVGSHFLRG